MRTQRSAVCDLPDHASLDGPCTPLELDWVLRCCADHSPTEALLELRLIVSRQTRDAGTCRPLPEQERRPIVVERTEVHRQPERLLHHVLQACSPPKHPELATPAKWHPRLVARGERRIERGG